MPCDKKSHRLVLEKPASHPVTLASATPQWPNYNKAAHLVGTSASGKVTVYYDATLGQQALDNAQSLLANADDVVRANDGFFGTTGGHVDVIVWALNGKTDGTGGADHWSCDYGRGSAIEVCVAYDNYLLVEDLFEAELSECSMGGNLCGLSTGEALSRWCAESLGNNAISGFASAPTWYQQGMPDWVNKTDQTDSNYPSIGCGMAFISWLRSLGYTLAQIAQAMVALGDSGTLERLYQYLSIGAATDAWPKFLAAVKALPGGVTTDDPFGGSQPPPPPPPPPKVLTRAGVKKAFSELIAADHSQWDKLIYGKVEANVDAQLGKDGYS